MKISFEKIIQIMLIIAILMVTVPTIIGCGYTYLAEDDFSFEGGANDMVDVLGSSFKAAIFRVDEVYRGNQGTYLFLFLIHYIRAYTRWGQPGFHIVMILNALFYIASLSALIKQLITHRTATLMIMLCSMFITFQLHDTGMNNELFFWYTGMLNYTIAISLAFLTTTLSLRCIKEKNKRTKIVYGIIATVTGFLGSGCALHTAGFNCAILLYVLILHTGTFRARIRYAAPFLGALTGAIVNVIAPGNWVHSEKNFVEGHVTFIDALRDTLDCYRIQFRPAFLSPWFVLVLAIAFVVGLYYHVEIRKGGITNRWMAAIVAGILVTQYMVLLPVVYGYHSVDLGVARTTISCRLMMRLLTVFLVLCMAQWVREHLHGKTRKIIMGCALTGAVGFLLLSQNTVSDFKNGHTFAILSDLRWGRMHKAYATRAYILSALELAPEGTDVDLRVPMIANVRSMIGMGPGEDPEWFVNRSAAGLFHLNSVRIVYEYYE